MKRFLAVLMSLMLILPMCTFGASAVSLAPADGWSDMWVTHFNTQYTEGAGAIILDEEFNVHPAWKINFAFAPVENLPGVYELVGKSDDLLGLAEGPIGNPVSVPNGGFVYSMGYGNDYSATGGIDYASEAVAAMIVMAQAEWNVGDLFQFKGLNLESLAVPTLTPDLNWYDTGYVCTAKYRKYIATEDPVRETIAVDGVLDDNGWSDTAWQAIDSETATWQKDFADKSLNLKYQIRTDDLRIYVGAEIYNPPVAGSGNGSATNLRMWFNTTSTATVATHYFDVYYSSATGGAGIYAKNVDSSLINAVLTVGDNVTTLEFSVPFSAIGADGTSNIPYFISCSTNNGTEEPCIYYPQIYTPSANAPQTNWYRANDGDLNPKAVRLNDFEYTLKADGTYEISGMGTYASNSVIIPDQYSGIAVTSIGERAFFDNQEITDVFLPNSVLAIGNYAFAKCESLSFVDFGKSLQTIGFAAFSVCTGLSSVTFPESLQTIDRWAFNGCSALGASITVPANVTTVGARAFGNTALTDIYCMVSEKPDAWSNLWNEYCTANVHWVGSDYLLGDVNSDKLVNSADLVTLSGIISSGAFTEYYLLTGDLNGDQTINSADLIVLSQIVSSQEVE